MPPGFGALVGSRRGGSAFNFIGNYLCIWGKVISAEEVIKIAKLPSKEMLLTQLATVLLANIRNLAVVLDQAREKMEQEA